MDGFSFRGMVSKAPVAIMFHGHRVKQTFCWRIFQAMLLRLVGENEIESQSHAESGLLASLPAGEISGRGGTHAGRLKDQHGCR